ncbi:MAG: 2-hydroxychromene-2-carboxylate isomerase [Acidiferrobacteraceae bacterium]|nr:2-hydroxychromene-2-carboxylate isomerase [Acidiferrobacteraceae bacterium]
MPKKATWYFDFVSPFSYLQFKSLNRLPDTLECEPVPILFSALLKHWGHKGPAEIAPKRVDTYRYCQWLAAKSGIGFQMPPVHPFNPLPFLRLALALENSPGVIETIFDYIWLEGNPAHTPEGFMNLASELGLDDPVTLISTEEVKNRLRHTTEQAIAAGVYGVPTFAIDSERFWGLDQTQMMLDCLQTSPVATHRDH